MKEIDEKDLEQASGGLLAMGHPNTYFCDKYERAANSHGFGGCGCCVHGKRNDSGGIYYCCELGVQ